MGMKLVSISEMKVIEKAADAGGVSYADMMQKAGRGLASLVEAEFEEDDAPLRAVGLVGTGNNGGDTLVALDALAERGWAVRAFLIAERAKDDPLWLDYSAKHAEFITSEADPSFNQLDAWLEDSDVLLDGVLGTGFKLPLKREVARVLGHVAKQELLPLVVAVDCPSGADCDSGEMAKQTIPADLTVCIEAVKLGLLKLPAFGKVGRLAVVSLDLPSGLPESAAIPRQVVTEQDVAGWLPARPLDSHKGTFGTALVVAGSINYTGAAYLACRAAYRIGAGLVQAAVPRPLHAALAGQLPEATWLILPEEMGVISESAAEVLVKNWDRADAILIGPGLGMELTTAGFIGRLFSGRAAAHRRGGIGFLADGVASGKESEAQKLKALVVDADGLKLLAKLPEWWKSLPALSVLTPHPGEMSVLTGLAVKEIQADRLGIAQKYAREWGMVVVLKGAFTVVAAPDGRQAVLPFATPALAKAGTGDVLAGMIVGLRAQGLPAFEAACAAAWIHAQAAIKAMQAVGASASVLAGEVADSIPQVLEELESR